jgi:hypothetical protein
MHIKLTNTLMLIFGCFTLISCSSGGGSSGGCDLIANANGPAYFQVENNLSSGLQWYLSAYAFGADMKPGECTKMGVSSRQFTVELQQCNIGGGACTSSFGPIKAIVFSVLDGETYNLSVDSSTFN